MVTRLIQFIGRYRILIISIVAFLAAAGILLTLQNPSQPSESGQQIPVENNKPNDSGGQSTMDDNETSVPVQLSEGQAQPQPTTSASLASTEPLSEDEINQILARLPALPVNPEDQTDFNLPQGPNPPPRSGDTIQQPFPPSAESNPPNPVEAGPLQVVRFSPEGEIPIAPFISITFNQPMVPLTTLQDLADEQVPVHIEPPMPGIWRWVGTKTLTFNYDSKLIDRLPKSTVYKVSIPAGTKSQSGGVLDTPIQWTFSTPPVKVLARYPESISQPKNPIVFISFDQRIDPIAVLKTIEMKADGKPVSTQLASESERKANEQVSRLINNATEGRWLAFRAKDPLPLDTEIMVTVGPETPSAEGPLLTKEAQSFGFRTYAALKIVDHGCSWGNDTCRPLTPFFIRFNNPIDPKLFQEGMLKIQPELPGVSANIYGETININGETKGRTTYTVVLNSNIQDIFGQKLEKDTSLTFKVGSADKVLVGPNQNFITLDPAAGEPVFSVYSINYSKLDVQIYAVQPTDWPAYKQYMQQSRQTDIVIKVPGRQVFNKTIDVVSTPDTLSETGIKLKQVMNGQYGHFIVIVKPHLGLFDKNDYWQTVQAWVQVTRIGLDAFVDQNQMVAWATDLRDGSPLEGTSINSNLAEKPQTTAKGGLASFAISNGTTYLIASKNGDSALLPRSTSFWGDDVWNQIPVYDELRWYVFDDRQMYKPGEEVHIKGWLRRIGGKQNGDVGLVGNEVSSLEYRIVEPQGNELGNGQIKVNGLGGFDLAFTIPKETNLGFAQITFQAIGGLSGLNNTGASHGFQIQEFRRPEFEVTARNETPGPYFAGDEATVAVEAKYYAGGALPNADVTWQVSQSPGSYSPPNWPDFTFGTWTPWWFFDAYNEGGGYYPNGNPGNKVETFSGKTDATGTHYLRLNFEKSAEPKPLSISAAATVMDVNRQAWTGTTNLLVHPANLYVGLRSDRYFVERGTPLKIDFIVSDLDGKPVSDRLVEIQAARLEWKYRGNNWSEEAVDIQKCNLASQLEPVACKFETPIGGSYRITAVVSDEKGRENQSSFTRWVSGGKQPPARKVEQEQVSLIPDKESYQPGDIAQVLVQAPFSPAEGLLTVSRSGILYTERFRIDKDTITLKIPIQDEHTPNLNIQVDVVGSAPRTDDKGEAISNVPPRPAYATGNLNLKIPPLQRTLSLTATPQETELEPGKETVINVSLKDKQGNPVKDAEVAVMVVDEAVLALTNYDLTDPVSIFYSDRPSGFASFYSRANIVLADPQALAQAASQDSQAKGAAPAMPASAPMPTMLANAESSMDAAKEPNAPSAPIKVRSDFNPLATFAPSSYTDLNGEAQVQVKLPDNLTRYRVMAVAVDNNGRRFGIADSNLVARLPLMVRPSAPRFLNFGDRFELPVVLQNQTDAAMTVDVAARANNLELTGNRGLRVTVPARDRIEIRFPAASQKAGKVTFQVAAVAGNYSDAATIELPVYTPATTEAFATYGALDEGTVYQPVASPTDVFPQFGGLEINTSSTALQALTDAVLYLVSYPFECTEQLSSRILGVAALRDVLTAFEAKDLPSPTEMEAAVQRDITRLQGLQNSDGGFPYWRRGQESIPFNTIHTAHALQRAKLKGFDVPQEMQQSLLEYLRQIETHYPDWYSLRTRQTLSAYALFVRDLMADKDAEKAMALIDEAGLEKLDLDAIGWLWKVLIDAPNTNSHLTAIRKLVNNRVVETAGAANFTTSYDDQTYLLLSSDRRTDAILLEALIVDNPQSDLIPKVVNGLLAHRTKGRWGNTQDNVFVLLSLDRYFNTFEAQTPDFVANIWLGDLYAGSHEFRGRTTDRIETKIPMNYLLDQVPDGETRDLILSKEGAGRLYYRLGLSYAPTDLALKPVDMGFVVQRSYEAVDNPKDVRKDENGVWHIKAGAKVKVRINMVADNRRYHVALVDPLPAGLEIINSAMAVSGSPNQDLNSQTTRYGWWWHYNWYEHQNLRDERAEAFTSLLWDGVYEYTYTARATTPGQFVVPPAKAEEMYSPEVFGRSSNNVVIVE
ncbi:MAG: alpha-2-macroglobulin family protein [Leptolinea sp.]